MKKGLFILFTISLVLLKAQEPIDTLLLKEVSVSATAPVTKEILDENFISENNTAQDIPILIENTTSIVSTSDAGNGVGYSGVRLRGTDATRILVSIDGVPINDSESQSVFWVNMPNVASTMSSIEVQRGVGSSSNGTANFGGSINLFNKDFTGKKTLHSQLAFGSFNTWKASADLELPSMAKDKLFLKARFSYITSDGYVDRASSDLFAYQLASEYKLKENTSFRFNYFGGKEKTYQAWYGVNRATLENDRTFNYAGAIYDENYSVIGFYPEQTDNYWQDHFQLHFSSKFSTASRVKLTAFYTFGRGYYQELSQFQNPENYKIPSSFISDLVRRKWLKNNFYGLSSNYYHSKGKWNWEANLTFSNYVGNHFGRVINSEYLPLNNFVEYYKNKSHKTEFSSYVKSTYKWGKLKPYLDIQIRNIHYKAKTPNSGLTRIDYNPDFNYSWLFFNPKIGMNVPFRKSNVYTFFGISNREPTRTDILNQSEEIKAERLYNLELGYQTKFWNIDCAINVYGMWYDNQLVLIGGLDDVGNPLRQNIGKSRRLGAEVELNWQLIPKVTIFGNATFSKNTNREFAILSDDGAFYRQNTAIAYSPELISSFGFRLDLIKNLEAIWLNKYVGNQYITNEERKELQLESYLFSNIKFHYKLPFQNNSLFLDLQFNNVFNRKYVSNAYVYDDVPYYYPQAEFNFMAGLRYQF